MAMRAWISNRPVAAYYLLTLAVSWGYWLTLIFQGKQVGPGTGVSHFPGLLGPLVAAFILTAYLDGGVGVVNLMSRIVRLRLAWPWGLLAALSPLPIALLVFLVLRLQGIPFPALDDFQSYPGLSGGLSLWVIVVLVFIVNGYGEEVGWRGFVMEKWLPRYGRFWTTIRIAGLWLVWHAPTFWLNQSMASLVGPMLLG